ncbi:MAG: winged helix-turn-helix transcriptional regulator [Micropruina sp.]|uniref:winged helix-turn-helix transcriptional regulator n=1 Tax=Micropruina sp. TaxID=2737536 RepID=UPI0039E25593
MAKRTYDDSCGIARALDLVGDRWSLLVVRELLLGPKRYTDLQAALRRIAPDILTQRLRDLEAGGLAERAELTGPGRARVYRLTERGRELQPVLLALGRFGSRLPLPEHPEELSPDAFAVALLTVFRPERAAGVTARIELVLGAERFTVVLDDGRLAVVREPESAHDATIETTPGVLTRLLWHGLPAAEAEASGALGISGDRSVVEAFLGVFAARLSAPAG